MCIYTSHFVYPFICQGTLGLFLTLLATVSSATMNISIPVSGALIFNYLSICIGTGISGVIYMLNFFFFLEIQAFSRIDYSSNIM